MHKTSCAGKHACQHACQPTLKIIVWGEKKKSKLFKWSCRGSLKEFCLEDFFASLCQWKGDSGLSLVSFCHNEDWQFTLKILFSSFPGKQVKVKPTNCCWQVPCFCFLLFKLAIWVWYSVCEWVSRILDHRFEYTKHLKKKKRKSRYPFWWKVCSHKCSIWNEERTLK